MRFQAISGGVDHGQLTCLPDGVEHGVVRLFSYTKRLCKSAPAAMKRVSIRKKGAKRSTRYGEPQMSHVAAKRLITSGDNERGDASVAGVLVIRKQSSRPSQQ
jgi:hypothetical protein